MKNKYSLVILDLDGTILNTSKGIFDSIKYVIKSMNLENLDENTLKKFVGPPVVDSFQKYCGLDKDKAMEATKLYRNYYWEKGMFEANIYDGIEEFINILKNNNIKLAVATLKREDQAIAILKHFGLYDKFDVVVGVDEFNTRKKKDTILIAMNQLECKEKSKVLMIGDTLHDFEGAEKACVDFVGITYGFGFEKNKKYNLAIKIFDELSEVSNFIGVLQNY